MQGKPTEVEQTNAVSNTSTADELLKFKHLKDEGVLSEEEFESQKQKILSGQTNGVSSSNSTTTTASTPVNEPSNEPLVHIEGEKGGMNIGMVLFVIVIAVFLLIMFASM